MYQLNLMTNPFGKNIFIDKSLARLICSQKLYKDKKQYFLISVALCNV